MARDDGSRDDGMGRVRAVFVLYLLIIVGGIGVYAVIGLTHH
jgi:hypothetical protein